MITITQAEAVKAYLKVLEIYKQPMNPQISRKLYTLKNKLKESFDFQGDQETKIINKYNGTPLENGAFHFEGEGVIEKVTEEIQELANTEVTIDMEPIDLLSQNIQISGEDIESIQAFIVL